jgi:hypothetical protein
MGYNVYTNNRERLPANMKTLRQIIPVRYKGSNYMVIQGSKRHTHLHLANDFYVLGQREKEQAHLTIAMADTAGCAFAARGVSAAMLIKTVATL